MSQSHLPPEEPRLSSEAPPQEGPTASQNPAPPAEDMAAQKAGKEKKPGAFGADLYGWLQALTFALAFILIFFTFFGRVIGVDGHSMDPTLNDRDMLFLPCIAYEPKQGDVVVLHLLTELAEDRQILLFTCQHREFFMLEDRPEITTVTLPDF